MAKAHCRESGCPIAFTLDLIGDKWSLLIIRDMVFHGKRSYGAFLESPEKIATNILADRLARLEATGIVAKALDPAHKKKFVYTLTSKGLDLVPMVLEIVLWGAKYDPNTAAPKPFIRKLKQDRGALIRELLAALKGTIQHT
ncbi:MAG: transcriptional regulator [Gaiellales bacterium]|nr:MAG: transcriptional regulator [Gaiellales bacterium]